MNTLLENVQTWLNANTPGVEARLDEDALILSKWSEADRANFKRSPWYKKGVTLFELPFRRSDGERIFFT